MLPTLIEHDIHLYHCALDTTANNDYLLSLLSPDEVDRAHRFRTALLVQRFIRARATLRLILSRYLGIPPETIRFAYTEHNKPSLDPSHQIPLQFNMAHSQDRAIYAIGLQQHIGVDIEQIKPKEILDIAKRYFTDKEYQAIQHVDANMQLSAFYHLWACKEALVKASGLGIANSLKQFSVSIATTEQTIRYLDHTWYLVPLQIQDGYAAALAASHPIKSILRFDASVDSYHLD